MVFDSLRERMGGDDFVTPMTIAHHTLFSAREKIELLGQLKADAAQVQREGREPAVNAEEIDAAIAEVRQGVQAGNGADTVLQGDF